MFLFHSVAKDPSLLFPNPFCHNFLPLQYRGHPLSPDGGAWTDAPHLLWKKDGAASDSAETTFNF